MSKSVWQLAPFAVVALLNMNDALGQTTPYRWNRTDQELGSAAIVTVAAQTEDDVDDQGRIATQQDIVFHGAEKDISRTAYAGSGGGGGDSGLQVPANDGADGADGADDLPADGADGAPGNAYSGLGGKAGSNGFASAWGRTTTIDELNPNLQDTLGYSWIQEQIGELEGQGGDGGGGGGNGSTFIHKNTYAYLYGGFGGDGCSRYARHCAE